ncbi:hypothetical protein C8J56DRAFT_785804 [Mycena floridula]|nr:hypothetical protein C8J56DRAFT_785804 [Mycena floridula]
MNQITSLQQALAQKDACITHLQKQLASSDVQAASLQLSFTSSHSQLEAKQESLNVTRQKLYASQKQVDRAQSSLKALRHEYKTLRLWNPTVSGVYTAEARCLARRLTTAGCATEKVKFAICSCASAFGITMCRDISRRTVSHAIDEGRKYGEIQLGREIRAAPSMIYLSADFRQVLINIRHRRNAASYAPGVDDSDQSTWKPQTQFLKVASALDHTAKCQVQGTEDAFTRIADAYSQSPIATRDGKSLELDDLYRKKVAEVKDHAADGKKGFKIAADQKKTVFWRDMGREALDDETVNADYIIQILLKITNKELEAAGDISSEQLSALSPIECSKLMQQVLKYKLGQERFDTLSLKQQQDAETMIFGGCCCHKDLNICKYGVVEMQLKAKEAKLTPLVLLANKANAAIINLSEEPDSAAVQNSIDSSASGVIKFLELLGSLLCHKDGERGYQDRCVIFMHKQKSALFDLEEGGKMPDTPKIRYQSFTYAAAEVIIFHGIIQELVKEVVDAKEKLGSPNHVEANILKALNDGPTLSELVSLALYSASVSWPYMAHVRGTKEKPVNLLDLTDIHRKLPGFCDHIAKNPHILLDPKTSPKHLTIDGKPFDNHLLIQTIQDLVPEFPDLFFRISNMFAGAAKGWVQFTPRFHIGGTFDLLTPAQHKLLFTPSTNDHNEGMLGSYWVHMRYHPSTTPETFSNQTRVKRNNTEAFIEKHCDAADQKYVMKEVCIFGASGHRAKFRKAWAALQHEKAQKALLKLSSELQIAAISLELDISVIMTMTSAKLKDQLHMYRDILKDPVLMAKLWKAMALVEVRRTEVIAALAQELERRYICL